MPDNTKQPHRLTMMPNQPAEFLARIVGWQNQVLVAADIDAVEYSLYKLSSNDTVRTPVDGHSAISVPVADAMNILTDDDRWTKDQTGYNFSHTPDVEDEPAWSESGKNYLLEYTLTPAVASDQNIKVAFLLEIE